VRCFECQRENRTDARYCDGCGRALLVKCPACGNDGPAEQPLCDNCGTALPRAIELGLARSAPRVYTPPHLAAKILTSRSVLEGERKQVTVLFCDIANSTSLAQRLGPEAMHALLNAFFELALAEVHCVEGTINQFLGDGFMALFGAPVAHEDHVRRALLSTLAIRQRLRDSNAAPALKHVHVRMGLNAGTVVVGKIGDNLRMDYTAIGDTTNLAARLQHLARPGLIYASPSVYASGRAHFDFRDIGKHALKGIDEPVAVYDLARARSREDGEAGGWALGIGSPLVGRDAELTLLLSKVQALAEGEGQILVIVGEPGAGKSRLLAEARRHATAAELLWLEGRAVSYGRSLSYWPFIEILKSCFEIQDDDPEEESWRKLDTGLTALFPERGRELLPYVATVLALRMPAEYEDKVKYLDGQGLRRQVFLCMRQLFEQLASRRPVVLLLEDWHWADRSSIELVEHLLPLAQAMSLLVCFVTRPDPQGPAARIRACMAEKPGPSYVETVLAPLSPEHSAVLVGNLVGTRDLPVALREEILSKTEGNPFFIEEVIRSLVADGVLARDIWNGSWQVAQHIDGVQLPDTIQGLILARIDRLEEEVKQALKLASVIGRSFFERVLSVISQVERNLDGSLAELERAELIRLRQQLPEVAYIFKHALVQEAAYSSILAERRRGIHHRVARAIEALFEDRLEEFTSLLAYHYTRAEDWVKAQEYLFKAGDQAGRMAADVEALEHFRQAEAAYLKAFGNKLSSLQRTSLARKIGAALYGTGHYEQAQEQFRRALLQVGLRYPTSRWGVRRAIVRYLAAHFFRRLRARVGMPIARDMDIELAQEISAVCHHMSWVDYFLDEERMLLDSLLELHVGEHSHYAVAEARGLSSVGFGFGEFNARWLARKYHIEATAVAQRTNHPSAMAFAWLALGFLDFHDGRWDEGEAVLDRSAAAYREAGDIHCWGGAALMLSFIVYFRGKLDLAAKLAADLVRAGEDAADPQVASWGLQNCAYPGLARDPLDDVAANLRKGRALAAKIPAWQNLVYQHVLLGKCYVMQGKLDDCLAALSEAMHIIKAEKLYSPFQQVELFIGFAMVDLALAERTDGERRRLALRNARRACGKAVRYARRVPGWLPEALRLRGNCDWLSGHRASAHKHWRESVAVAEKSAFPIERGRTLLDIGHHTGDIALIEEATQVFRRFGAKVFLAFALHALAQAEERANADAEALLERYSCAILALEDVNANYAAEIAHRQHEQLRQRSRHDERGSVEAHSDWFGPGRELGPQIPPDSASA
jgi:class 3 adenylate cyclase/tetratricopeptide (TPR) repeat protein